MPSISVIMPCFNVEKYMEKAIDSLLGQTFSDFELIIVDDGSTDGTGSIADAYAEKDARVRVFHQENAGAPKARNNAMKQASGKYLFFMDGDDWAESNMLEDMFAAAEKDSLQVLVTGFYIDTYYSDGKFGTEVKSHPDIVYKNRDMFRQEAFLLFDRNLLYTPWNKLYLREYIESRNITFTDTFWDDFPYNLAVFRDINRVGVLSKAYYHFNRARSNSETSIYRPDMYVKREEEHTWMQELYRHWGLDSEEKSLEMVSRRYVDRVIGCVENITCADCNLDIRKKLERIGIMIRSERVSEALKYAHPAAMTSKLLYFSLRLKSPLVMYIEGRVISYTKSHMARLFTYLKTNR